MFKNALFFEKNCKKIAKLNRGSALNRVFYS